MPVETYNMLKKHVVAEVSLPNTCASTELGERHKSHMWQRLDVGVSVLAKIKRPLSGLLSGGKTYTQGAMITSTAPKLGWTKEAVKAQVYASQTGPISTDHSRPFANLTPLFEAFSSSNSAFPWERRLTVIQIASSVKALQLQANFSTA